MAARVQPVRVFKSPMAWDVTVFMYSHETHTQHECCIKFGVFKLLTSQMAAGQIINMI